MERRLFCKFHKEDSLASYVWSKWLVGEPVTFNMGILPSRTALIFLNEYLMLQRAGQNLSHPVCS